MPAKHVTVADAIASVCARPVSSPKARRLARDAIIDTLACMVAGRHDESVTCVRQAFIRAGDGSRRTLLLGDCEMPGRAALANGTAAHALDFDDNFTPGMSHASAVIVPAILALVDPSAMNGARVIDAYLAGLQAQALVGRGVGQAHYTAGWHGTSTIGSIGTAAAAATMLGLDENATADALTIAVSLAAGPKGQFGTLIKPFHAGMAARNAVEAALLSQAGMRAKADILEGAQGFHELFAGDRERGWHIPEILAERDHVIETHGLLPKRHPCCGSTHLVIDALLELKTEHGFTADAVDNIETLVGIANFRNLAYEKPKDHMQARFSMPYCVARALRQGSLALSDFTPDAIVNHASDPLLGAVTMCCHSPEFEQSIPEKPPHVVTVHLKDGRSLQKSRAFPVGDFREPFSEEDRLRKFLDCCADIAGAAGIYNDLKALDKAQNLDFLRPLFA